MSAIDIKVIAVSYVLDEAGIGSANFNIKIEGPQESEIKTFIMRLGVERWRASLDKNRVLGGDISHALRASALAHICTNYLDTSQKLMGVLR